jgi:hypothetical protein
LVISGKQPEAITIPLPGTGSLTLASAGNPSPSINETVEPGTGSLLLSGIAPVDEITHLTEPITAEMRLTVFVGLQLFGYAPTVEVASGATQFGNPDTGSLTLASAGDPSAEIGHFRSVPIGSLTFNGQEIDVGRSRSPATGTLSLKSAGFPSPEITHNRGLGVGSLVLNGQQPSRIVNNIVRPTTGAAAFGSDAPTLAYDREAFPGSGSIALASAGNPSAEIGHIRSVGTGGLSVSGITPSIGRHLIEAPGTGSLAFNSDAVAAIRNTNRTPTTGSLVFTGFAPGEDLDLVVKPTTTSLSFTGQVVTRPTRVMSLGALTLTGTIPTLLRFIPGAAIINPTATTDVPSNYEQCDLSGFRQLPGSMKLTWNKYAVRKKSYDERHPATRQQSGHTDKQTGAKRPEQNDRFIGEDIDEVTRDDL